MVCHRVLPLASQFDTILFADDTFLVMSDNNLSKSQSRSNTELRKIDFWMKKKQALAELFQSSLFT